MSKIEYKLVKELTNIGYETVIEYYDDGSISYQSWYLNGKKHREDEPSYIEYNSDGSIYYQEWYLNGKRHREDGLAVIRYNKDGSIWLHYWCLNGKILSKKHFTSIEMIERMKAQSLFTLKELLQLKRNA